MFIFSVVFMYIFITYFYFCIHTYRGECLCVYMGTKNKYYERIQYTAKTFTSRHSRSSTNEILQRQYIH
jgi:hypothetical protein